MEAATTIRILVLVEGDSDAAAVRALEAQAELKSFRRFQAMPHQRGEPVHQQLRRFLGTRAKRKVRCAKRLVESLDPARLPHPLVQLAGRLPR